MPGILLTYNRHENSEAIARFRTEFARESKRAVLVGAGALLRIPLESDAPEAPADRIRALLPELYGVVFLIGPHGLDAKRPGDLFTVREAIRFGRPVIAVLADGARLSPEFSQLPTIALSPHDPGTAVRDALRMIRLAEIPRSLKDLDLDVSEDAPAALGADGGAKLLSEAEIQELLKEKSSGDIDPSEYGKDEYAASAGGDDVEDSLSQNEIDALLQGADDFSAPLLEGDPGPADLGDLGDLLGSAEKDGGTALEDIASLDLEDLRGTDDLNAAPTSASSAPQPVAFAAYLPEYFDRVHRQHMFVYAHLADDPEVTAEVERDVERFREDMGGEVPAARRARNRAELREGTRITMVPECDDLLFDPPELTKRWRGPWTRFDFEVLLPKPAPAGGPEPGEVALVRISIRVAGIEIAHINCSAEFIEKHANPLAAAKASQQSTARAYQKIFISYSRRDFEVTRSYQAAQKALGNDVFLDTESIRTGENWQAALARAIDAADVMQLFWSAHSARSPNVRDEWQYALEHRCPADRCAKFIRPVYWRSPMPEVPAELGHLHFRLVDLQPG